ncbi:unnamed protein product, partial [Scytosiphon promiscuus]
SLSDSEVDGLYNQSTSNARIAKNGIQNSIDDGGLKLSVYPNPTFNSEMTVETNSPATIKVIDILGAEVRSISSDGKIEIKNLSKGAYFIQAVTQYGVIVKKIIFE